MFPLEFRAEVNHEETIESWGYPLVTSDPTLPAGNGSGRVYPRVRVYPQASKLGTHLCIRFSQQNIIIGYDFEKYKYTIKYASGRIRFIEYALRSYAMQVSSVRFLLPGPVVVQVVSHSKRIQ